MRRLPLSALCLVLCGGVAPADVPPRFQDSINYAKSLQDKFGGFRQHHAPAGEKAPEPTLRATLAGIRTIKYFGGELPHPKATQEFIAQCYDEKTGGFADTPGGPVTVLSTALGLMAVVDAGLPVEKYRDPGVKYLSENVKSFEDIRIAAAAFESLKMPAAKVEEWIQEIRKMQNPDGTFGTGDGTAFKTGSATAALLRLGGKIKDQEAVIKALRAGQQLNGGFGKGETPTDATLSDSYRIARSFYMLNASPEDVEGLRSFVEKCRNADGGYSNAPAEPSNLSATYYAAIIHYWLKEK